MNCTKTETISFVTVGEQRHQTELAGSEGFPRGTFNLGPSGNLPTLNRAAYRLAPELQQLDYQARSAHRGGSLRQLTTTGKSASRRSLARQPREAPFLSLRTPRRHWPIAWQRHIGEPKRTAARGNDRWQCRPRTTPANIRRDTITADSTFGYILVAFAASLAPQSMNSAATAPQSCGEEQEAGIINRRNSRRDPCRERTSTAMNSRAYCDACSPPSSER